MGIDKLATRIAAAPRGVVLTLAALTAMISPGFVRVSPEAGALLAPQTARGSLAERSTAVFELGCTDGVFTEACLRFVARVTQALELEGGVVGAVRSLSSARVVRQARGELQLDPLARRVPATELGLRLLRARVQAEPMQARLFIAPGERATFVYAELDPKLPAREAQKLAASLRERFERSPALRVSARSLGERESAAGVYFFGGVALTLAVFWFVLAPGSWRASALVGLAATAFAVFAHGLVGLLDESGRALAGFAPELLGAIALATGYALIQRTRASQRREANARASLAAALTELGPTIAIAAALSASGFAALLAFAPAVRLERGLGAAAGLATGLVVYPLGVTLAGLRAWPNGLAQSASERASVLGKHLERALARPRLLVCVTMVGAAVAVLAVSALAPEPGAARLRTVVLDSGSPGGALEPAFLERVQVFQRAAEGRPGVVWSSSLVDSVVAPAFRALHDGDPVFATVPPTRADVVRALRPWQRDERLTLSRQVDAERRRVAVELLVVPANATPVRPDARPLASTLVSLLCVAALAGATLRSLKGALLCVVPGASAALFVLALGLTLGSRGEDSTAALAPLAAGMSAAFALQFLMRTRALLAARAELEVALSLALRETGPAIASAAFGSGAAVALLGVISASPGALLGVACLVPPLTAAGALASLPALVRRSHGRFFSQPAMLGNGVPTTER